MIKKYVVIVIFLLAMLVFTFISVASTDAYRERISERIQIFQDNSLTRNMWNRLYQYKYNNDNVESDYADENYDGDDNDVDIDYDEPEEQIKEDVKLPKIIVPDGGNEPTEEIIDDSIVDTADEVTNSYADGTTKLGTIDPDGPLGRTLTRIVEVFGQLNEGKVGQLLTRVIENICDVDSSDNEVSNNIVDIVEGEPGGSAKTEVSNYVIEGGSAGISNAEVSNVEVVTDTN